jgi:tripartite-type tricarboxylate transporter receptor subunit TctC
MSPGQFGRRLVMSALAILAPIAAAVLPASAQSDYPNRPIRLIVGFAAGGGNDIFARLVAAKASDILGQAVVVENKPGAGGRLSAEYVSNQTPDGYTLLVGASGAMSIAAAIYPDLKYHPTKTLTPLAMIGSFPLILVVGADNPAKTVKDLVEQAKQHPDKANYPSTSPAFTIAVEQLKLISGMPAVMIPYKSSNEMILSVMEGQSMMTVVDPPPTVPQVKAGKVKALAVTGAQRAAELPDTPSMTEAGYPGVDVQLWSGVFAPAATPGPVVAKLQQALAAAIRDPGVSDKLKAMAVDPGGGSPEEFRRMIDADIVKFTAIVKAANLHFEE